MKPKGMHRGGGWRRWLVLIGVLAPLLAACSSGKQPSATPSRVEVGASVPVRRTFHDTVAAFGQLAADPRHALSLSVPHSVRLLAAEVVAGQRVKQGDPLLQLETDPTTRRAYVQAQAALKVARAGLARTERLHAQQLATNAQLDSARQAVADAQAALSAQAQLGGAEAVTTLRAPADGVVTALSVQSGQQVAAGTTLLQFAPTSALSARLGVDPGSAAGIRVGMAVTVHAVYAASGAPALHGRVATVGDVVDPQSHLVEVVATLGDRHRLPAGSALSATIKTRQFTAWAVPRDALQSDAKGKYVYQIEHGKAHRVDVEVLAPDGSPIGIKGRIDPHARVITTGSYAIAPGTAVQVVPAKAASTVTVTP